MPPRCVCFERPRLLSGGREGLGTSGEVLVGPRLTRFGPTRSRVDLIQRADLIAMVNARRRPVTAVTAPGGWGKSILAGQLAADRRGRDELVIWLTVDRDQDVTELWIDLIASTGYAAQDLVPLLAEVAVAQTGAKIGGVVDRWLSAVSTVSRRVTVVFDDAHRIHDPAALDSLVRVVEADQPGLEVVLIARYDLPVPLQQWRMRDVVTEVRAADLAVHLSQADQLLQGMGVDLDPGQLGLLVERAQGWIGGVRLAGQILADSADPAGALLSMVSEDSGGAPLSRYLIEQVVADLHPDEREVLVPLGALETLPVELGIALTGRSDTLDLCRRLVARTGFVESLGVADQAFRCHQLLGAAVRYDLEGTDPQLLADLRRRAAQWYADQGQPVRAVRLALAARDWGLARALLLTESAQMLVDGRSSILRHLCRGFPREYVSADLMLAAAQLTAHSWVGDTSGLAGLEDAVAERRSELSEPELRGIRFVLAMARLADARIRGDFDGLVAALAEARDVGVPAEPESPVGRPRALVLMSNEAVAELWRGNTGRATSLAQTVIADQHAGPSLPLVNCLSLTGWPELIEGRLSNAWDRASRAVVEAELRGWSDTYQVAAAYVCRSAVAIERMDLVAARRELLRAERASEPFGEHAVGVLIGWAKARASAAAGDLDGATATLGALRLNPRTQPTTDLLDALVRWAEAEVLAAHHDWEPMQRILDDSRAVDTATLAVFAARRAVQSDDFLLAKRILRDPASHPNLGRRLDVQVRRSLWLARAQQVTGQRSAALTALRAALDIAEREGYRLPFLELGQHARPLLGILEGTDVPEHAADVIADALSLVPAEPAQSPGSRRVPEFTAREREFLVLLPTRMSNDAIAATFHITANTVKTHLRSIYRKLDVPNRNAAIARAEALGLL